MKERRDSELLKEEAEQVALELVQHAKETARQMLLGTNLDISKIPLICNKIVTINDNIEKIEKAMSAKDSDHEVRIRSIESMMWKWIGLSMVVPPIVTILIAWIINTIKNG